LIISIYLRCNNQKDPVHHECNNQRVGDGMQPKRIRIWNEFSSQAHLQIQVLQRQWVDGSHFVGANTTINKSTLLNYIRTNVIIINKYNLIVCLNCLTSTIVYCLQLTHSNVRQMGVRLFVLFRDFHPQNQPLLKRRRGIISQTSRVVWNTWLNHHATQETYLSI
jgi:hypothetical protein